jgi:cytochrome c
MPRLNTMMLKPVCLALLVVGAWSAIAHARDPEHERARVLLEELCSRCHAIGEKGKSPNALAPPFRTFGDKLYDPAFFQRLQDGLTTMHKEMPTFRFSRDDAGAVIGYLKSIQRIK